MHLLFTSLVLAAALAASCYLTASFITEARTGNALYTVKNTWHTAILWALFYLLTH